MQKSGLRQKAPYILIGILLLSFVAVYIPRFFSPPTPSVKPSVKPPVVKQVVPQVAIPVFSPDSAYLYTKQQVDFGPRVPNTAAHKKCSAWFVKEMKRYGLTVTEQKFQPKHHTGVVYDAVNIIGQYKPELPKRIMIAAHWDSRYMAEKDTKDKNKPIDGADDGASGVGIILELARTLKANPVDIGVDFVLFDAEDQGENGGDDETWCLGSQYWASNPHAGGRSPYYAVLLDMVGAKGAKFKKEGYSVQVAPAVVSKVWGIAAGLGHGRYFVDTIGPGITDDHVFVVKNAGIPMIDIINLPGDGEHTFGDYHHKHSDNMNVIDKNTLKAVGETMTALIYGTYNEG